MDYISVIIDSVETSISMKIFKNKKDASLAHIFKSKLVKIPLSVFKNVDNFNPNRLKKSAVKAYPLKNRPRGELDISSVKYYQKQIQQQNDIAPIWMIHKTKDTMNLSENLLEDIPKRTGTPSNKYILLDGAHRIVASYIEDTQYIYAYIINI